MEEVVSAPLPTRWRVLARRIFWPLYMPGKFFSQPGALQRYGMYFGMQFCLAVLYSWATFDLQVALFIKDGSSQHVELFQKVYWISAILTPLIVPWIVAVAAHWLCTLLVFDVDVVRITGVVMVGEYAYRVVMLCTLPIVLILQSLENPISLAPLATYAGLDPTSLGYALASMLHLAFVWEVILVALGLRMLAHATWGRAVFIAAVATGCCSLLRLLFI